MTSSKSGETSRDFPTWITPGESDGYICRSLRIPNHPEFTGAVLGALVPLTRSWSWKKINGIEPSEAAELALQMFLDFVESDCMIGTVLFSVFDPNNLPAQYLLCDGSTHNRDDYPVLYDRLHSTFIVSGTQFKTPDLIGRTAIGAGSGEDLTSRSVNEIGGAETHELTTAEMPEHNHTSNPHSHTNAPHSHGYIPAIANITTIGAGVPEPTAIPGAASTTPSGIIIDNATVNINSTGGGEEHNNMPPFTALIPVLVAK